MQRPLIIIIINLHFLCYHLSTPVQNVNTHIHNYCRIVHFFNLIFAPFKWMQSDKCYAKYFLIKFTTLTYHLMPPQVKLILSCCFFSFRTFLSLSHWYRSPKRILCVDDNDEGGLLYEWICVCGCVWARG